MRWTIGAAALLCAGAACAADLRVQRTEGAVSTIIDGTTQTVGKQTPLAAGQRVQTGEGGRAELQVEGGGSIVVGIYSRVLIENSEPPEPPARAALIRLRLETGALRIDARKQAKSDAADIRLQLPFLKMRVFGAEAFVLSGPDGDEVCVLSGAIEVSTPRADERIDRPRECLRWTELGTQHFEPDRRDNLAADMLQASFGDDHHARYAVMQELERTRAREAAREARAAGLIGSAPAVAAATAPASVPLVKPAPPPMVPAPAVAVPAPTPTPAPVAAAAPLPALPVTTPGTPPAPAPAPASAVVAKPADVAMAPAVPAAPSTGLDTLPTVSPATADDSATASADSAPVANDTAAATRAADEAASTLAAAETPAAAASPAAEGPDASAAPPSDTVATAISAAAPTAAPAAPDRVGPSPEWHIVLFTFSLADTAQRAVRNLASRYPHLLVRETQALGRTYYRVMTTPFASLAEANIALERLHRHPDFAKAWILPPS